MVKSSPSGVTSGEHFEASWGFLATFSQYMASQMKTNIHTKFTAKVTVFLQSK